MCRLFTFRSVLQSHVHRSLETADNALAVQSAKHPDGWGVGYYVAGAPHIIKSPGRAQSDRLFHRISGIVTSHTVVAHVRRATQGEVNTLNCHPFQYGRWIFAHNGDVPNFDEVRPALCERVAPVLRRFVLGDTDSEIVFHLLLTHLQQRFPLERRGTPIEDVVDAARRTVDDIYELWARAGGGEQRPLLSFVLTDGELVVAHQGGKELRYSTFKRHCPERDHCAFFADECEAPTKTGFVNHLVVTSEPLHGENVWMEMAPGDIVGVDHSMRFHAFAAATCATEAAGASCDRKTAP